MEKPAAEFEQSRRVFRGEPAEEVFGRFLSECARHAFANERAILETDDIEGVHQMRVGLRRLRACLSLFKPLVPAKAVAPAAASITPLLRKLGPARDWDVFLRDRIDRFAGKPQSDRPLRELRELAALRREEAYAALRRRLTGGDHRRGAQELPAWIARRGWRDAMSPKRLRELERPIDDFVREALQRTRRKALDRGRKFHELSPEDLHRLRIVVKKHRYPVDFFAGAFPGRRGRDYGAALKTLQTELGRVNDVAVARELCEELDAPPGLEPAVAALMARAEKDRRASFSKLPDCWSAFRKRKAFWKQELLKE